MFMGHASITITPDHDGHFFRGAENEAATPFDTFLAQAVGSRREVRNPIRRFRAVVS